MKEERRKKKEERKKKERENFARVNKFVVDQLCNDTVHCEGFMYLLLCSFFYRIFFLYSHPLLYLCRCACKL